ncbi:MAG: hypothetical protein RLZZ308_274 [Candidatus Parcubacteria bacterium]|jgi:hypothetical protein
MKKTIISLSVGVIALSGVFASAADTSENIPASPEVSTVSVVREEKEYNLGTTLARLQNKARILIKQRIDALTANKTAINASKLTDTQKSAIVTRIDSNITRLTTLGTTIASSTDATSTKTLVASIYSDFRIFGIIIPQLRLEKRIYDLQNHSTKLSDIFTNVQTRINERKNAGYDVTVWQKKLDDAKMLVANDMYKLDGYKTQILALTVSQYGTTSKATIESVNKGLKEIAKDFNSVRSLNNQGKGLRKALSGNATTTTTGAQTSSTTVR